MTKSFKILIADDNLDNILLLKRRLRRDNYLFYTAQDGQAALTEAKRILPDLILLDVNMPKLDGFEVCHRLRAFEATRLTPIIIITAAKTSLEDQVTGLGLGADDYLTKPVNYRELAARVERKLQVKVLEDELRRQKEELEVILTSTTDAVLRIGPDGQVHFLNPAGARLFGLADSFSAVAGADDQHHYQNILAKHPHCVTALEQVKTEVRQQPANCEIELADGRTMLMNVAPVTLPGPQLDGWVLVLRDITHLKEIDRLKSVVIANAAHDLKNPLSSALLYLELLVEKLPEQNDLPYKLAVSALQSVERMKHMTTHMLDLDRLETGQVLEIYPCDIVALAHDTLRQMANLAQQQAIDLVVELPSAPLMIPGDPIYLGQAIANLLHNALKFTPAGGMVTFSLKPEGQNVIIAVADSGPGIAPEYQAHIFDRFYRVKDQSNLKHTAGSGLGLAIVKAVVTQHQGLVWLESQPGQGSTFYVSLPRLATEERPHG